MNQTIISATDVLAKLIHTKPGVLIVLERMGIKLGFGNKTIEQVAEEYHINTEAFLIILNLFCNDKFVAAEAHKLELIPDLLKYLKASHAYFLNKKIPYIQNNLKEFVNHLHDSKAEIVESFYNTYIEEVTEHIDYENETVFPYIEEIFYAFKNQKDAGIIMKEYDIDIYDEHHEDIEDALRDLKNILIRHLPQKEEGSIRRILLEQLFELESDLSSHTRIEDEVLIPLVKKLENNFHPVTRS